MGEWVAAIGAPFGFENSVTAGIVSAKGRSLPDENYVPFIQTDVPINPGNSGGPLFNLQGAVVGINSQIYSRTGGYMGLSFAIPIDVAMNVADQLRHYGKVTRGRLGLQIQALTPDLASSFGLSSAAGALVARVDEGSPAARAGIRPGDVILKYDGTPIRDVRDLPNRVAATKPGTRAEIDIWRDGASKPFNVTVGELPPERVARHAGGKTPSTGHLGLALRELTSEDETRLGVDHGLLVEDAEGSAAKAGIREGDVVLAVNRDRVSSVAEFNAELKKDPSSPTVALLVRRNGNTLYVPVHRDAG